MPLAGSPAARRRLGLGLAIHGAFGLVLVALAFLWIVGPLGGTDGPFGIDAQRARLVRVLSTTSTALGDAEVAVREAHRSLDSTGTAAGSAGGFMTELGGSLRELASALRVSILGSQPFARPADEFERVANRATALAADLDTTATSVRRGAGDLRTLADQLIAMRTELDATRAGLATPIEVNGWRVLASAVLVWLAVPAAFSLWLGLRWWRPAVPRVRPVPAE